jgi:RNA polymerase sigma-70 factor (ECF subfamily)
VTEKEQQQLFENWLHQHKAAIFKVVRAYSFTPMDQDDLFQEIIIQVWHSIPSFRLESSVLTWIYRIALNTAIKWVRKERKHAHVEALDNVEHILQDSGLKIDERLTWLYEEISKLDEIDRSITHYYLMDLVTKKCFILGITESNVGVKINRIKKQLISKSKKYDHYGI